MYSRDPVVRSIATQEILKEAKLKRPAFRPFQEVVDVMKDDPGATRKRITTQVKAKVQVADNKARLAHSAGLCVQGQTVRDFHGRAADLWSTTVQSLSEHVFKFALNALTDTLPHNCNLHLWKKLPSASCNLCGQQQSLLHVLNACPYALEKRRYNDRHDGILESIYIFRKKLLPPSQNVTADLPNLQYRLPALTAVLISFCGTSLRLPSLSSQYLLSSALMQLWPGRQAGTRNCWLPAEKQVFAPS